MDFNTNSGIYFLCLKGKELTSVNADRPAIAGRSIKVNYENCKYGKAKNLRRRYRDYCRVFGESRLKFFVIFETQETSAFENLLDSAFGEFRMKGTTGRKNEWLQGIDPRTALILAKKVVLEAAKPCTRTQEPSAKSNVKENQNVTQMGVETTNPRFLASEVVSWTKYIRNAGFTNEDLKDLHHFARRTQTFNSVERYFSGKDGEVFGNNKVFAARLQFVAQAHQTGERNIKDMIKCALDFHPL